MVKIESYKQLTDKFVPEQYKASVNLRGMLDSLFTECDNLEDVFFEILESLNLEIAIGPALDFLGAIVGVERKPGETDEDYRARIYRFRSLKAAPTYEGIREMLELLTGQSNIGLYPCWPAGFYWVPPHAEEYELSQFVSESVTSGVDIGQGTFLCCEEGEPWGLIVLEDNKQPFVIDQRWQDTEYAMVDDEGYLIVDDEDNVVVGIDYFTTNESFETN
jgi:hypothetical protein